MDLFCVFFSFSFSGHPRTASLITGNMTMTIPSEDHYHSLHHVPSLVGGNSVNRQFIQKLRYNSYYYSYSTKFMHVDKGLRRPTRLLGAILTM